MSEWRELTWDDAMRRGYEVLVGGEALYEEIDASRAGPTSTSRSTCGALSLSSPKPTPGCHGAGVGLATGRLRKSGTLSTAAADCGRRRGDLVEWTPEGWIDH
jgi:hypothetical protein